MSLPIHHSSSASARAPRSLARTRLFTRILVAGTLLAGAGHASAAALEEVVVTAEKREESLQNTPISLVAFGSESLEKQGVTNLYDLPRSVPSLQITPAPINPASLRVFIRGVGSFDDQLTQDPSVAVYTDGVYMARSQGLASEVADLERVEVLRGPQGSLYGRNATGGAINFITREPELGKWGFSQSLTVGSDDELRARTMVNAPLGDDAALRLGYSRAEKDGFTKNSGTGADTFGAKDRTAARADLRWQPAAALDLRYSYDRSHIEDTALYFTPAPIDGEVPRPTRSSAAVRDFKPADITAQGHQLTANWDVQDHFSLKSISAYRKLDNHDYQDMLTYIPGIATATLGQNDIRQEQWSQELQAYGDLLDEQFEYIAGIYYFRERADGVASSYTPAYSLGQSRDMEIENTAAALFGQAIYSPDALDRRLHLTLGVRQSSDRREAELAIANRSGNGPLVAGGAGEGSSKYSNFSPSVTLAYDLTYSANLYLKYAKGYKSGGFNVRPSTVARFEEGFGPEQLVTVEAGAKTQWLDDRLRFNVAVFHSSYDDIQINTQSDYANPQYSDILNAGKATISGVELEFSALIAESLTFGLNYAYLDARYDKIENALGVDVTDNYVFVNVPHNSLIASIDYDIATTPAGDLRANVNYSYQSDMLVTTSTVAGRWGVDGYGLLNGRLTLADIPGLPAGKLRVSLWGKNLADEKYSVIHAPAFNGYRAFGDPRSAGVELVYEY